MPVSAAPKAIEAFDRDIGLNPKNTHALVCKGIALVTLGRFEDAITNLNRALEDAPRDDRAWYYKGISFAGFPF